MGPKRIAIIGASASGKSTLGRQLALKTNLPLTHIDAVMWRAGWNYIGDEETVRKLKEISSHEEWIIEGYIEKDAFDPVLNRADLIIYLDYPRYVPAWRYVKRSFKHRKDSRPELEGSPDKFSLSFLKRIWDKQETYHVNKFLEKMPSKEKILYLKSPEDAETLLRSGVLSGPSK